MKDLSGTPTRVPRWGPRLSVIAAWLAMLTVASGYVAVADSLQDPSPAVAAPDSPRAVLNRYCVSCHNAKLRTAGLALDTIDAADVSAATETWEKVVRKLRSRAMPPAGSRRPDEATYDAVALQLEADLDRLAAIRPNPGTLPAFRRLTRTEYRNAIRDLLALDDLPKAVDLASLLPADNSSTGFDNLADLLFVSTTQLEDVVRLGHVQRIDRDEIVLEHGTVPTSPEHLHVHCATYGLSDRVPVPIFTTITLSWPTAIPARHSPSASRLTSLSTHTGAEYRATNRSRTG